MKSKALDNGLSSEDLNFPLLVQHLIFFEMQMSPERCRESLAFM